MDVWCDRRLMTSPIYYGLCITEKTFHKELRRMQIPRDQWPPFILNDWSDATVHHFDGVGGKQCAIVCIRAKQGRSGIQIAALLVHEAVHIWQAIRESMGEKEPSSEFEAYSIQCIAQELMEAFTSQVSTG